MNKGFWTLLFACFLCDVKGQATIATPGLEHLFTEPRNYQAPHVAIPPTIDGQIDDEAWRNAPWSAPFTDIEGSLRPSPPLATRMKMIWTDSCLFIAAELQEPQVWATLTSHDDIIFHDNDFEVFIDPDNNGHTYYEIEVNAQNTIFDLFMPKPYRNGSGALIPYNTPGMRTAVSIDGTLNRPGDTDRHWTVELCIPFSAVTIGNSAHLPKPGEVWRINFSRVEWDTDVQNGRYVKRKDARGRALPEHNWVWSPQGVVNMHYPERWGYLQFSSSNDAVKPFTLPYSEKQRQYLWLVYYRQKAFYEKNKRYAGSLEQLGVVGSPFLIDGSSNDLRMDANAEQFLVRVSDKNGPTLQLNEEGLIQIRP